MNNDEKKSNLDETLLAQICNKKVCYTCRLFKAKEAFPLNQTGECGFLVWSRPDLYRDNRTCSTSTCDNWMMGKNYTDKTSFLENVTEVDCCYLCRFGLPAENNMMVCMKRCGVEVKKTNVCPMYEARD